VDTASGRIRRTAVLGLIAGPAGCWLPLVNPELWTCYMLTPMLVRTR